MAGVAGRVGCLCFPFTTSVEHHTTIVTTLLDFVVLAVTALIALRTPTRPGFASLRRATLPTRGREKRAPHLRHSLIAWCCECGLYANLINC